VAPARSLGVVRVQPFPCGGWQQTLATQPHNRPTTMARTALTARVKLARYALMTPKEFEQLRANLKLYKYAQKWARGIEKGNPIYCAFQMQAAFSVTPHIRERAAVLCASCE